MVCDEGLGDAGACMQHQDGVPAAAADNVASGLPDARGGGDDVHIAVPVGDGQALSPASLATVQGRRAIYERTEICPDCGAIKSHTAMCAKCRGTGRVKRNDLPPAARDLVGDADIVDRDRLVGAFAGHGEGRIDAVRALPGLVQHLDERGRERLLREAQEHPRLAMLGRTPDALVEAGGRDVLVEIAREHPRLAKRSLRTAALLGDVGK